MLMNCTNTISSLVTCNEDGDSRFKVGDVFMVFEYGDFDLAGLLDSPGVHLSNDHIRSYTNQLLEGVCYMHNQNILHRDLKPSNIYLNEDNHIRIVQVSRLSGDLCPQKRPQNRRFSDDIPSFYTPKTGYFLTGSLEDI